MKSFSQALTIILSALSVFIIINTSLEAYISQILALFILFAIIYIVVKKRNSNDRDLLTGSTPEVFAIIAGVLLTISLTGGLNSALFFLIYFLLFGIAFMLQPAMVFVFLISVLAVFGLEIASLAFMDIAVKIGAVVLLSPIAYFFGAEFKRRETLSRKVEEKTMEILEDTESLIASHKDVPTDEEIDTVDDIMEAANELRSENQK